LHDVGAPIELLWLVFKKIGAGESVAICFDKTAGWIAGNRRVAGLAVGAPFPFNPLL
jgi:hypothetical protein